MFKRQDVLVACALKKEARGLRDCLEPGIRMVVTGLGVDRTLHTLEEVFDRKRPSLLVFTGMAGQLDPGIQLGEFVFPTAWALEGGSRFESDAEVLGFLRSAGWTSEGLGLTVRSPVVKAASRLRIFEQVGARICDMESAAALMICRAYEVPCLAPKIVSDTADSGMLAFYRHFSGNIARLGSEIDRLIDCLAPKE